MVWDVREEPGPDENLARVADYGTISHIKFHKTFIWDGFQLLEADDGRYRIVQRGRGSSDVTFGDMC